jgi:hypothetical protein
MSVYNNHHNFFSRGHTSPLKRGWDENGAFSVEISLQSKGENERLFV